MSEWKRFGFGCMRLPVLDGDNSRIDIGQFKDMVDWFLEHGYRYFDTAYPYHNQKSELAVGEALVSRHQRDSFLLADKMPVRLLAKEGDMERIWSEQLERTGAGFFDYYLLHAMSAARYEVAKKFGVFEFLQKQKEAGRIRHLGMSFHDSAAVLDQILGEHPELEFVQLQLNYLDWDDPKVQSRLCYETVVRHGMKVWVMEPMKGGMLANLAPEARGILGGGTDPVRVALSFVASLPGVEMILSGMHDLSQVRQNLEIFDTIAPLSKDEEERMWKTADWLRASVKIGCTSCRYCTSGCPRGIDIPSLFQLANQDALFPGLHGRFLGEYQKKEHKASECIRCFKCAKACPQQLDIPNLLKDVVRPTFDD